MGAGVFWHSLRTRRRGKTVDCGKRPDDTVVLGDTRSPRSQTVKIVHTQSVHVATAVTRDALYCVLRYSSVQTINGTSKAQNGHCSQINPRLSRRSQLQDNQNRTSAQLPRTQVLHSRQIASASSSSASALLVSCGGGFVCLNSCSPDRSAWQRAFRT